MTDQKFKKVRDLKGYDDYKPKKYNWRHLAWMVAMFAAIMTMLAFLGWAVIEIECRINWRELCG